MTFKPIKYRAHNGYDTEAASNETAIDPTTWGPSLTIQSMTEDADINVMMKRYGVTGKFPENTRIPQYGDYSGITDFRTALEAIANAQEDFMRYPADFRARFDNDPQRFLEFTADPANRPEMAKLGLLKPRETPATPAGPPGASPGSPGATAPPGAPGNTPTPG